MGACWRVPFVEMERGVPAVCGDMTCWMGPGCVCTVRTAVYTDLLLYETVWMHGSSTDIRASSLTSSHPFIRGGRAFVSGGGGGVDTALGLDPQNPTKTDPWSPEVTRTQDSAKNENGIFGISASRGFRTVIICHVFGAKKKLIVFNALKKLSPPSAPRFIITDQRSCQFSPFPETPAPHCSGALSTPSPLPGSSLVSSVMQWCPVNGHHQPSPLGIPPPLVIGTSPTCGRSMSFEPAVWWWGGVGGYWQSKIDQ